MLSKLYPITNDQDLKCFWRIDELPIRKWNAPTILSVRVNPSSTVSILSVAYSVPSRLIGYTLKAYIYSEEIELYYGNKCLQKMSRISNGYVIDYRHIIDSLVRKPGAFVQYQYYEAALFHQLCKFREPLNSTIKFDHKMSHSFIPIGDRHRPFLALSHQLCKFREPLNSTIKFDHKMSHSFIPIGDRHRPFFGNIINCQI